MIKVMIIAIMRPDQAVLKLPTGSDPDVKRGVLGGFAATMISLTACGGVYDQPA
jgi:hypothetical protein